MGKSRVPWGFRVDRGKGELPPIKLGQRLLKTLPKTLTAHYEIRVLGDSAFGSIEMLKWVKKQPRTSGIFGIRSDRRLASSRQVSQGLQRGQQVVLQGLNFPVTLSWYWLSRDDGSLEKRFVISTKPLSAVYITRLGRRRWQIEGFFKTVKHRLGLHRERTKHFIGGLSVASIIFYCLFSRLLGISSVGENYLARLGQCGATSERNFVGISSSFGAVN